MTWVFLAVAAQFINAGVALVDKYIVTGEKSVLKPFTYAFYTCLISGAWIVIYLFGLLPISVYGISAPSFSNVMAPTLTVVALSLLAAYAFFFALVSLFQGLRHGEASDVVPVVGAVSAIVSFGLGHVFLATRLTPNFLIGLGLLALGTFLVSHYRFSWRTALSALHAGIFFAIHYVAIKNVFNLTNFDDGFFWSRIAFVVIALSMLLVPRYWSHISSETKEAGARGGMLVFSNKVLAGIGTILILKATELGDVSIVQALGGLQFIFILLFSAFLFRHLPLKCADNITCNRDIYHKAVFISIIVLGFFILFV